jgi:hypothetical protein
MWRAGAAGLSALAAAASGVVTALVTAHPSVGLWVALGVLVVIGAALQAAVVVGERRSSRRMAAARAASGEGAATEDSGASVNREVRNTISGGIQYGPVVQGGDFSGTTFGSHVPPPDPPQGYTGTL